MMKRLIMLTCLLVLSLTAFGQVGAFDKGQDAFNRGDYSTAIYHFQEVKDGDVNKRKANIRIEMAQDCKKLMSDAQRAFDRGDYPTAMKIYNEVLSINAKDPNARKGIDKCRIELTPKIEEPELVPTVFPADVEKAEEKSETETVEYFKVEVKPTFQGGDPNAFSKWVNQYLQYPEIAKDNGIKGRVILQFTIGTDGYIRDIKVVRGVDKSLDDEAVRVVKSSPKWTPGRQEGVPVNVTYTFPVIFDLR